MMGLVSLGERRKIRGSPLPFFSLPCEDAETRHLSARQEEGPHQERNLPALWPWIPQPPHLRNKCVLLKPLSQWYLLWQPEVTSMGGHDVFSERAGCYSPEHHCLQVSPSSSLFSLQFTG